MIATGNAKEDVIPIRKSHLLGIPNFKDAIDAGTLAAESCTLILAEGISAKTLAMAGIEIFGRDKFGVFVLKGKPLNVRNATISKVMGNEEFRSIMKIIDLQPDKKYTDKKSLRYGSVMIMTDQDHDGSHIKGLIINFFHYFWPELLHMKGFLRQFITPVIKATKGTQMNAFFTVQEFKRWFEQMNPQLKGWKIKYYKGLGTSTDKEAKDYFHAIEKHRIDFEIC